MTIRTVVTEMFGLSYPIVSAPMAVASGGELASAVSNVGGLGLVGGGYGDITWLERELAIVAKRTTRSWGIGLITWSATREAVDLALAHHPHAFFLSFGDARAFAPSIKDAGSSVICQIQDVAGAEEAIALGADIIVAQGTEAGGHGASRGTLPLVPVIVDAVAPTPVLAAGGIGDGRGLAAALALGAEGAVIGTRLLATEESLFHPTAKDRLVAASGDQTVRTQVFDEVRGLQWPAPYTSRALRNRFVDLWHGHDERLADNLDERERYFAAVDATDFDTAQILAGEIVDMIDGIEPAGSIIERVGRDAEDWLRRAPGLLA
jgi:nitronate monooxygenase